MDKVDQLLTLLTTMIQDTKDFILGQAPEVIQEILRWNMVFSIVWIATATILIALSIKYWGPALNWDSEHSNEPPAILLPIIGYLAGLPVLFVNAFTLIKILIAPKLFLLEYALKLSKHY